MLSCFLLLIHLKVLLLSSESLGLPVAWAFSKVGVDSNPKLTHETSNQLVMSSSVEERM